ncbi:cytochrome c oxidase subunit I [Streptomyces filamentosus]|uniref:cytochrome c oxidase subunit I n=1 Tax=Streptomyces filamentosus TaxID=67294 RepID=UPI00123A3ADB|nr:cbb3-type cytochrome c oxidase subunit I [Streptomyces filamentosus]KAA6216901.1 hypothetical protein CP979_08070 [Streptomyces filamentosus]
MSTEAATTAVESGRQRHGRILIDWLTTTDHKKIGHLCLAASFVFFLAAGPLAMAMRAELARPGLQFLSNEQFNQAFTQHGTIMLLLFATPAFAGFANELVPLQIGAPDVAFPRLNMFSYWLFLLGGLMVAGSFLTPSGPPDFGWTAYAPLNGAERSPGTGADLWITGLALSGFGTILTSVNFLATIIGMRAPGMTMFRMPVFSLLSFLIAVPTGVKFFDWTGTMLRGSLSFETPMLWATGFPVSFLFGGLTGVVLASPPMDLHVSDSYFVVAHFHYTVFGTVVFATFAGFHFWWPKFTGRMLDERLGKVHFWTLFTGFHLTFLVQHWLGAEGMPRRYADYLAADGFTALNTLSTIGAFLLGISTLPFLYNVWRTWRYAPPVGVDDPWGHGRSLEWATSCPPPRHNFTAVPRIRSESPAFDLHHPEYAAYERMRITSPPPDRPHGH